MLKRKPLKLTTSDQDQGEDDAPFPLGDVKQITMFLLREGENLEKAGAHLKRLAMALFRAAEFTEQASAQAREKRAVRQIQDGLDFFEEVRQFEIQLIRLALKQTGGNQRQAARLLGIKSTTLLEKKKRYNL